ncbi:hypothetical protein SS50377_23485 [Spironucleus salmonicida]|uniref:Rhodanese domain-containing protein n=1 Tax=Spironucleus salmonicida TaxID=348837 RepID=V6LNH7_9EUKA|nr:hypothetical protein SS50377_23485 [Spironucleus salmonicida]|eukprot:EST46222.1 hypothetical protein SS50377_13818 [Spironucleus salmonicida]
MNPAFIKEDWLTPLLNDIQIKILCANDISEPLPNTQIFHIQKITTGKAFAEQVIRHSISRTHFLIIYDNDGISAPLLWFQFLYFGHALNNLSIIKGGYKSWQGAKGHLIRPKSGSSSSYSATPQIQMRIRKDELIEFCRQLQDSVIVSKIAGKYPIPSQRKPKFSQLIDCRDCSENIFPGAINISWSIFIIDDITVPNIAIFDEKKVNVEQGIIIVGDTMDHCAIVAFNAYLRCGEIDKIQIYFENIQDLMGTFLTDNTFQYQTSE